MAYNPGSSISFKSYSLGDIGTSGAHYFGGYYEAPAAHVILTIDGVVTQTLGAANQAKGARAFCVASGAGGADLVLTVSGISITDAGVRNGADSEVIVADTDTAITDQYFETTKKWLGQITYTLTGAAGAFTFNYGFVKYEDFGNRSFTVTDFEITGNGGANETGLNVALLHHDANNWTYSAAAFNPASGREIVSLDTDYSTDNDLSTNEDFAYKRTDLSQAVAGSESEGVIVCIVTAVNNSIDYASIHVGVMF